MATWCRSATGPVPFTQMPPTSLVHPDVRLPVVARPRGLPMTPDPDVAATHPVPEAADPDVSGCRRSTDHLHLRRRRRGEHDLTGEAWLHRGDDTAAESGQGGDRCDSECALPCSKAGCLKSAHGSS